MGGKKDNKERVGSIQAVTKKEGLLKRVKLFKIKHRTIFLKILRVFSSSMFYRIIGK